MSSVAAVLRHTPLYERHRAAGARLIEFAGWEMPVRYAGIRAEHLAVRGSAGVFDVSHMGQIEVRGPGAAALLQRTISNDVRRLAEGGAQYGLLCNPDGGVIDDLITYRLADCHFLVVTNAANHERDLAWLLAQAGAYDVDVLDRLAEYAMLAVQGPRARALLSELADGALPSPRHCCERSLAGVPMLVCGTGYTGEAGAELLLAPAHAPVVWDAVVAAGAQPCGLGARDTLRLEVCLALHGNELSEQRGPIQAGLGWCCEEATAFIGADRVAAARTSGIAEKLVDFRIEGDGIARAGSPIVGGGAVTSGTFSPCLEAGIGMAYVPSDRAEPGTCLEIDVRGKLRRAIVKPKPLYRKEP